MEYVVAFLVGTVLQWVVLLIVIPIAQKLTDFSLPPWPERMWKLAVVSAATVGISLLLMPVNWFPALVVGAIAFFGLLYKWFDIDLLGAIVIVIASRVVAAILNGLLLAGLMAR